MSEHSGDCQLPAIPATFFSNLRCGSPTSYWAILYSVLFALLSAGAMADTVKKSASKAANDPNCLPYENTTPLCMFTNPEDLAVLPDKKGLIVSEYGDIYGSKPGALAFYDIPKQRRRSAFDGGDGSKPTEYWGDSSCTEPPGKPFSPHGIDLSQRSDGRWQLLAVQHGGRESVEFFEVKGAGEDSQLVWRGCAVAPSNAKLNAVAVGKSGEFFTTKMFSADTSWESEGGDPNKPTGLVYRWSGKSGFDPVAGTEGVMPNGIAASDDGNTIYVVYSGESRVKKIDVKTGDVLVSKAVSSSDNIKWSADGKKLLAASFDIEPDGREQFAQCMSHDVDFCPIDFSVVELDPETLSKKTLFENHDAPMGAGTVGLKVGSVLFIGSLAGNRILQVDLSNSAR